MKAHRAVENWLFVFFFLNILRFVFIISDKRQDLIKI